MISNPPSAFSSASFKTSISSIPDPYRQLFLSPPLNLGFNQENSLTAVRAAVSQGLAWNLKLWVWKVFLMGLCILLLETYVSGSHKTLAESTGMAANLPQHGCHGRESTGKREPIYSTLNYALLGSKLNLGGLCPPTEHTFFVNSSLFVFFFFHPLHI